MDCTRLGFVTDGGGAIGNVEGDMGSKALHGEAGSDISEATDTGDLKSGGEAGGELTDALVLLVSLVMSWLTSVVLVTLVPFPAEQFEDEVTSCVEDVAVEQGEVEMSAYGRSRSTS